MDQQMPSQLNSRVSVCCRALDHKSKDGSKDRSRRLRKVSQRFLNIYKNSEMSHIDRQVKKLSAMADKNEPKPEAAHALVEEDPVVHLDKGSASSDDDVRTFPLDTHATSCMPGSVIGEFVHQTSNLKEKVPRTPHYHGRQRYRRYSDKVMSVFKGRRGRPPKPLWVRVPRLTLTIGTDVEVDSCSPTEMKLERDSEVSESSSVDQKALFMCNPTVQHNTHGTSVTTSATLKSLPCASSEDLHSENRKLRNRPPLKRRRVDKLDVNTPSNHHSYILHTSVSSSFKDTCDGFGDSAGVSGASELPSCAPLFAGKEHCSEKEEERLPTTGEVMEIALSKARLSATSRLEEDKTPLIQSGLIEIAHPALTTSTAERECKAVCLCSSSQNGTLQSVITNSSSVIQDQQHYAISTDSLSVSIPKEMLGALWLTLNTTPPTVVTEDKIVPEATRDHEISSMNSLVADGAPERNSSSSLVVSLPVVSIHSPSCGHTAKENQGLSTSSFSVLDSLHMVSLAEVALGSEFSAPPPDVASTELPGPLDEQGLLPPVDQNHNTFTCSVTMDTICDKTCTAQMCDGHLFSSCASMEAVSHTHPAVFTTQEEIPDKVPLVQYSGTDAAVDGDGDAISNHCHSSIQASLDKCYNDMSRMAKKGFNARALDSGRCSPCLCEPSHLPEEDSKGMPLPCLAISDKEELRAEWIDCNSAEDIMNQQCCQPLQPATDAVPADQEAMKKATHEASESSVAALRGEPCSSISLAPAVESSECLHLDSLCTPSDHHPVTTTKLASGMAAVEDPHGVCQEPVEAVHNGSGDSTLLIASEVLNPSGEAKERGDMTEVPMKTDPPFNVDKHEIKAMRPQRELARRRRNEKAFLYDENLVDLILAEHEPLLPVGKDPPKTNREDKAFTVPAKPYLRHRGLAKASKQKDAIENSSSEAAQTKGSCGRLLPLPKQKNSRIEKSNLFFKKRKLMTAASKKLEGDKDGKKKLMEEARARCSYSSKDKATAAKGSTSAAKLAVPKVPTSLKGRRCAVSNIVDANIRVKSKVSSEGKQPVNVAADEYHEKSALEPPPPRSRNYWRTAQAWLPRKVPETRQDVVALRQRSQGMKTGIVSKSHLEENNGWRWLGDPISVSKYMLKEKQVIRSYFIGMRRGRKQAEDILARDCVLVFSGDVNKFPYVGRIVSLWQDSGSDEMMFTTAWYHRPADVLGRMPTENYSERELFASSHQDDNPVASILCKCFVMGYNEYCRFRGAYSCSQSMVKSSLSDILVPNPSPHQPVNFHIPAANSKIDLSHVFYCKNSLVSARHHTNRMKTDQRMRLKYMQKGVKPY